MDSEETPLKENRDTKSDIENNTKIISSRKNIKNNQGCEICLCLILSLIFMIVSICLCERNLPDERRMCS
jgi:hypothetical protein